MKTFACVIFALLLLAVPASAQTFSSRTLHFESTTQVDPCLTADAGVLPYAAGTCGVGSAAAFRSLGSYAAGGTCGGVGAAFDPRLAGYATGGCGGVGTNFGFARGFAATPFVGGGFRARGFGAFADPFVGVSPFVNVNVGRGFFGARGLGFGGVGRGFIGPRFHGAGHAVGHVHSRARLRF